MATRSAPRADTRPAQGADGRMGGGDADRAGRRRVREGLRRSRARRRGDADLPGDHRRAARSTATAAAIISPSPAPTTASGTRSKNSASPRRTSSRAITPTRRSRWSRRPGWAPATRSPRSSMSSIPAAKRSRSHRDYHMGFQSAEEIAAFPAHAHNLSPVMTLQGAVAHCDMPVESGPTLYLPFSQNFLPGYFAWRRPEFIAYFDAHHVQLPLAKGDAAFFNPALFHAAGRNSHRRRPAHGEPVADFLAVRPGDGIGRPRAHGQGALSQPARHERPHEARAGECDRRGGRGLRLPHQSRPRSPDRRPGAADPGATDCARRLPKTGSQPPSRTRSTNGRCAG